MNKKGLSKRKYNKKSKITKNNRNKRNKKVNKKIKGGAGTVIYTHTPGEEPIDPESDIARLYAIPEKKKK